MIPPETPARVVWDITYACPLRCTHCYSESGRRPSRQLGRDDLLKVTDALISLRPESLAFAGGEPLLVKEILELAERVAAAGIKISIYTGGWHVDPSTVDRLMSLFNRLVVSVDGATPGVHDRVRGRVGSFDRVMTALARFDAVAGERKARREPCAWFGVDFVVLRSNFDQLEGLCSLIPARFPNVDFIAFGAVIPSGLAAQPDFADRELLTPAQLEELRSPALARRLQALVPASVTVFVTDNAMLQMHPDDIAAGRCVPGMQVEADGMVRAMSSYEGTVGSLLTEPPSVLWKRAVAVWDDPFVRETITPARTMRQWADATRNIDLHFGSADVTARIERRGR